MGDTGERAEVALGVKGQEEAIRAADDMRTAYVRAASDIGSAFHGVGGKIGGAVGGAIQSVGSSVSTLTQDTIRLATAMGNVSLERGLESAERFNQSVARLAATWGTKGEDIKTRLTGISKAILVGEPQIATEAAALAKLTGNFSDAVGEMEGLGEEAIATGKSAEEMAPLGEVLHNVLGVAGDTREAIGKIRAQAEELGVTGGPMAFEEQIASLGGVMDHFSLKTEEARNKLTALMATLGKGLTPSSQRAVQSSVLSNLQQNGLEINRTLGEDIYDPDTGKVKDPVDVLLKLNESMKKRGINKRRRLLAYRRRHGVEAGTQLFNAIERGNISREEIERLAGIHPSETGKNAAEGFKEGEEGERIGIQLSQERAARGAAEPILSAQTVWGKFFQGNPVASIIAGNMLSAVAHSMAKGIGGGAAKLGVGIMGLFGGAAGEAAGGAAAGGGGAVAAGLAGTAEAAEGAEVALTTASGALGPFAIALAGATAQLGLLASLGKNRDEMGKEWRDEHAGLIEGEKDNTPSGRRARREQQKSSDVSALIQDAQERSDLNKALGEHGFEDMVKAYDPKLYDRVQGDPELKAVLKALATGKAGPEMAKEIGDRVAAAIQQNPPVVVSSQPEHPVAVVKGHKAAVHHARGHLRNTRGHHGG